MNSMHLRDCLVGLVLLLGSFFAYFVLVPEQVVEGGALGMSPRFFPKVGIFIVGFCSAILIATSIAGALSHGKFDFLSETKRILREFETMQLWRTPLLIVLSLLCMNMVFEKLGYQFSIPPALFLMMVFFGERRPIVLASVSVLVPILLFVLFNYGLNMPLE